jgi:hypothetical protein
MRSLTVGDEDNNEYFARFASNPNDNVEDMGENDPHDIDAEDAYMAFDMDADLPSYPEVCVCMHVHLYMCYTLFQGYFNFQGLLVEIV